MKKILLGMLLSIFGLVLPSKAQSTNFITSTAFGTPRNNYGDFVGDAIRVGANPITVTGLGRVFVSGNNQTHIVKIVTVSGVDVTGGSVSINMTGTVVNNFVYANLAAPVTLAANSVYYLVTQETAGGDMWYDFNTQLTTTNVATITSGVYHSTPSTTATGGYILTGITDQSYGPVDMQYSTGSNPPPNPPATTNLLVGMMLSVNVAGQPNASIPHSVILAWSPSSTSGVTSYNVYRSTTSGGPYQKLGPSSGTSFQDGTVISGTKYFYVVTAVLNGVESVNSNEASAQVP